MRYTYFLQYLQYALFKQFSRPNKIKNLFLGYTYVRYYRVWFPWIAKRLTDRQGSLNQTDGKSKFDRHSDNCRRHQFCPYRCLVNVDSIPTTQYVLTGRTFLKVNIMQHTLGVKVFQFTIYSPREGWNASSWVPLWATKWNTEIRSRTKPTDSRGRIIT